MKSHRGSSATGSTTRGHDGSEPRARHSILADVVHIFVFLVAFFALEGTNIRSGTCTVVRIYTNQRLGSFGSSDCNSVCARKRVLSFFVVFNVHCVIWGEEAFQLFNLFPNLPFALSLPSPVLDSTESVRYVFLCFPSFFFSNSSKTHRVGSKIQLVSLCVCEVTSW